MLITISHCAMKYISLNFRVIPVLSQPQLLSDEDYPSLERPSFSQTKLSSKEDYLYVEQPSNDFFCPVTFDLLLQPHLTSCCGMHISQQAATRIKEEKGPCPLCANQHWNTVLNKHFRRQVKSFHVFCCYEDRGCEWQGELARYEEHISSCKNRKYTEPSPYE